MPQGPLKFTYTAEDFPQSPMLVFYEVTRACDLVCKHCRACAQPKAHPKELTPELSRQLLSQIAQFPHKPLLVFTGGDPMKRADIFDLVRYACEQGLQTAMTPSATPLVTNDAVSKLKEAGLGRLAMSLDGASAEMHDNFRGEHGAFEHTLKIMQFARSIGLELQVNTTVHAQNYQQIDTMADLFGQLGIALWSVFFLIPVGRGLSQLRLSGQQAEWVFERLWAQSKQQQYGIKTTEAHHYRRYVLQHMNADAKVAAARNQRAPLGINDGKGVMFVSHTGVVHPSGFMPITCGQFPKDSVIDVYQKSELFKSLREPDMLKGKCGACEFRAICGGSRARAYAVTRDPLGAEPDCIYQPKGWQEHESDGKKLTFA